MVSYTYLERSKNCKNKVAQLLFNIMESKKSNLAVSADVSTKDELLALADKVGPYICILKTHIDILEDFDQGTVQNLKELADIHQFIIFEDRKFADIGNTVDLQYNKGIYKIADWAKIVNAHSVPGPGIISGLKKSGLAKGNALLLLAEMSSAGNLATGDYTTQTVEMAKANDDFVIGFITRRKLLDNSSFINMTPGVQFTEKGDSLGQQYISPYEAIQNGADVIIVGRGIYMASNPAEEAKKYRAAGWKAYEDLVVNTNDTTQ